ncbi:putative transposase [Granulicella pectinivorans]|uniref:Putative transposase n=1 Tax=Granulicella pectinivorans TaxID=474950 RepID=A0A1I6M3X7_9BACT|nr:transposase [Granulicella pectinivorans]SFS10338.1 putative transposase [Granulicella pectinivorans]
MPFAPQEIRTYFITSVTANRRRLFQIEQNSLLFINHLNDQRTKGRLHLHAFVVMPDHIHLLLTPSPEISLEKSMQFIKGGFSFLLKSKLDIWQKTYDSRRMQDASDFATHVAYIHQNPIRKNLALQPEFYSIQLSQPYPHHRPSPTPLHPLAVDVGIRVGL